MNPWVLRHLRLARARGSLVAPNSPIQDRALEVLEVIEEIDKEKARADTVRLASSLQVVEWDRLRSNFPEYFAPVDPYAEATDEDGNFDIDKVDDSKVEWRAPASPDDDDEISRWIRERESDSVSAADMDQYDN